jgi:hypothetical protein
MFRQKLANLLVIAGLLLAPAVHADTAVIRVYKGELNIIVPDQHTRDSLLIRYRSKTREVVRIAVNRLALINTRTKQVIYLRDQSASLSNRYDHEGFWNTDIYYSDVGLGHDNYRIQGVLTLYLPGSQRTGDFSAYLKADAEMKPHDSSIDWGLGN